MDFLTRAYMRFTARKGQAMTEYALILAAVAVVAFVTYQTLGGTITGLLSTIIADL